MNISLFVQFNFNFPIFHNTAYFAFYCCFNRIF